MRLQKLVLEKFESDRKVADAEQQLRQIEVKAARLNKEEVCVQNFALLLLSLKAQK